MTISRLDTACDETLREPRRVVVTGAGGFIGRHLVRDQLSRGREVVAVDRHLHCEADPAAASGLIQIEADIRDRNRIREVLAGSDTVFHLASAHLQVGKPDSFFYEVNVEAAANLVTDADDAGIQRFVHCSSVGVFGPLGQRIPANELSECKPDILYEKTKLAGEEKVLDVAKQRNIELISIRPAWVYGPGCPRTEKLFRSIRSGKFAFVGSGQNLRHPIYIQDMIDAFELASSVNGIDGEIVIVAGERAVTLEELVATIAACEDRDANFRSIPFAVMKPLAWAVETGFKLIRKEPPFSTRSLKFFSENSSFDISKARDMLGFVPKVTLEEGVRLSHSVLSHSS